ncbi:MAG: SAM-dependent methyltransferase [Clostridia bacterium]|nr:SAM-dependent methyltransferase [Clostridia bacterium]
MSGTEALRFAELVQISAKAGRIKSCTLYKAVEKELSKAKGSVKKVGGEPVLQLERFWTEGRLTHENIPFADITAVLAEYLGTQFRQADLVTPDGSASLMISSKGKVTLLVKGELKQPRTMTAGEMTEAADNNRTKKRLLTGEEDFLKYLGVSDENGRVHDKKQSKFRQICRFVEYIKDAADSLPKEGKLYTADLCCGKSYLSFAAYYTLTAILGREVDMVCVDLKESVIRECAKIAADLHYDGMHFLCQNIFDYQPENPPHLVISLHACDTATDAVLEVAMRNRAWVVLSTPCCHHDMNNRLNCPAVDFIGERPLLRQKFCDAATDALRLLRLEAMGYKTDATELIDPEETPKNIMLRAWKKHGWKPDSPEATKKWERYRDTYRFLYSEEPPALPETI